MDPSFEFKGFIGPRVDTSKESLIPGLIDCHVHLVYSAETDFGTKVMKLKPGEIVMRAFANAQASLKGGITTLRDLGGMEFLELAVRDGCNSGAQFGPTIRAAGQIICMTDGYGNQHGCIADGEDKVPSRSPENRCMPVPM